MTFKSTVPLSADTDIAKAAEVLLSGGVVAFPTDTVYGVGAHFQKPEAIERIYRIKGRPKDKPLQLILSDIQSVRVVAVDIPQIFWRLAEAFLPGGITLILRRADSVLPDVISGAHTVAVRVPDSPVALRLVRATGAPIAATSANLSGMPSPITAQEVIEQMGDQIDMVIDGGPTSLGRESTILDLTVSPPVVLREGAISIDAISRLCPDLQRYR